MKKIVLTVTLLISLMGLSACSSSSKTQDDEQEKVERIIVISSDDPIKVLPAFTTFSWDDQYSTVLSAANTKQEAMLTASIQKELITYLNTKGYRYQPDPTQADVVFGFVFALKDVVIDKKIEAKFGLLPGMNKRGVTNPGYRKGTFLLTVLDSDLEKVYWRSALLGFADLEKDINEQNTNSMQVILQSMLGGFPRAGR